jgi:hypothetical protein
VQAAAHCAAGSYVVPRNASHATRLLSCSRWLRQRVGLGAALGPRLTHCLRCPPPRLHRWFP